MFYITLSLLSMIQTPLTDDWCAYADSMKGELVVGGVFLRLFIASPGWTLSQPTKFATELLERLANYFYIIFAFI